MHCIYTVQSEVFTCVKGNPDISKWSNKNDNNNSVCNAYFNILQSLLQCMMYMHNISGVSFSWLQFDITRLLSPTDTTDWPSMIMQILCWVERWTQKPWMWEMQTTPFCYLGHKENQFSYLDLTPFSTRPYLSSPMNVDSFRISGKSHTISTLVQPCSCLFMYGTNTLFKYSLKVFTA